MSFLGNIGAAMVEIVTLPVAVVADIATLGGAVIGRPETFTGSKVRQIVDDVENATDDLRK